MQILPSLFHPSSVTETYHAQPGSTQIRLRHFLEKQSVVLFPWKQSPVPSGSEWQAAGGKGAPGAGPPHSPPTEQNALRGRGGHS